ncbi:MAG TPA: hypothetical protein VGA43_04525 [Deferrimonas sp.]|jgi:hypothetical protein
MQPKDKHEEIMVLAHDPVAGYRPAFYLIFAVGLLYLGYIFLKTL